MAAKKQTESDAEAPVPNLSPQERMAQALKGFALQEAREVVAEIQDRLSPESQLAELTGVKKKKPFRALGFNTIPDHTLALDSDGRPAGRPDTVKCWVPRLDFMGRKEDSRIHSFKDFGYEVVKDRGTQEEVEGRFGVLMEADPETAAMRTHTYSRGGRIDPFTYFTAQAMEAIENTHGSDHVHVRTNREHHSSRISEMESDE